MDEAAFLARLHLDIELAESLSQRVRERRLQRIGEIVEAEGAKFWLGVLTELKNRGVQDVLIASIDGLVGFPEAIETVLSKAQVQLCIVHMVRGSLTDVSWKERRAVAKDLRAIYQGPTEEAAEEAVAALEARWDTRSP